MRKPCASWMRSLLMFKQKFKTSNKEKWTIFKEKPCFAITLYQYIRQSSTTDKIQKLNFGLLLYPPYLADLTLNTKVCYPTSKIYLVDKDLRATMKQLKNWCCWFDKCINPFRDYAYLSAHPGIAYHFQRTLYLQE